MRFSVLLSVLFLAVLMGGAPAAQAISADTIKSKHAYMVDFDTGAVLLDKDSTTRMAPSSMTKVMTMYLVFEALESGRLKMSDELPVSQKAWATQGSKMFVAINSKVAVEDLIQGVIVQSGNDATIVLAEGLAGSEESFARAMNAKAEELGMGNTHFLNASGWPQDGHYSTARDLAVLARALITRFPQYYHFYSQTDYTYNKIKQGNRNPLLYKNIGADGLKTGHSDAGGYGLIGTGKRDGRRVIFVVNGLASMQERADEATGLLEWGLGGFANLAPYEADRPVVNAKVVLGAAPQVPLKLGKNLKVTVPKLNAGDVTLVAEIKEPLMAPVKMGDEVGVLKVTLRGGEPIMLPLVAANDVAQMGLMSRTIAKALYMTTGKEF